MAPPRPGPLPPDFGPQATNRSARQAIRARGTPTSCRIFHTQPARGGRDKGSSIRRHPCAQSSYRRGSAAMSSVGGPSGPGGSGPVGPTESAGEASEAGEAEGAGEVGEPPDAVETDAMAKL